MLDIGVDNVTAQGGGLQLFVKKTWAAHSVTRQGCDKPRCAYLQDVRIEMSQTHADGGSMCAGSICGVQATGSKAVKQIALSDSLFSKADYEARETRSSQHLSQNVGCFSLTILLDSLSAGALRGMWNADRLWQLSLPKATTIVRRVCGLRH